MSEPDPIEASVRALCAAQDLHRAAEQTLARYGREILGLLHSLLRSPDAAEEVFASFCEALWRGLPSFAWDCSLRTWAYVLARHAAYAYRKGEARKAHNVYGSQAYDHLAQQLRSQTAEHLRTENKSKLAALRDSLTDQDRLLLTLRLEQRLGFTEVAQVMHQGPGPLRGAELTREAARLRKRYQLVKDHLKEEGRRLGLFGDPETSP